MKKRNMTLLAAIAAAAAFASSAQAAIITVPTDGYTGDYRLAMVVGRNIPGYSFGLSTALSTDIGTYNGDVSTHASQSTELSALGATWVAIGSTGAVNVRTNTGTVGTGGANDVPIYNLAGVRLFDGNADLWSSGSPDVAFTRVDGSAPEGFGWWTGTNKDGTTPTSTFLGSTTNAIDGTGSSTLWVNDGVPNASNQTKQLLGMSSVIAGIPEPTSLSLLALSGLVLLRRRRA